jgi:predicted metal-dependent hydrolase
MSVDEERRLWEGLRRWLEEACEEVEEAARRMREERELAEGRARELRLEFLGWLERLAAPSQQLLEPEPSGEEICRAILDLAERLSAEDLRQMIEDLRALLEERRRRVKA